MHVHRWFPHVVTPTLWQVFWGIRSLESFKGVYACGVCRWFLLGWWRLTMGGAADALTAVGDRLPLS